MRGRVFIAPVAPVPADGSMIDPSTAWFWASWQDEAESDGSGVLEDVDLVGAEAAIRWGRARFDTILIRLGNRGDTYFSAGLKHADIDDETLPVWPPQVPPAGGWWELPTVPTLEEIERVAAEVASRKRAPLEAAGWAMDRVRPAIEQNASAEIRAALLRLTLLAPSGLSTY